MERKNHAALIRAAWFLLLHITVINIPNLITIFTIYLGQFQYNL